MAKKKSKSKNPFSAETLYKMKMITSMQLSPDGQTAAYAVQRLDRSEKKYSDLWLVDVGGSEPRQITFGDWVDVGPKWSPDGPHIAFLSNRGNPSQMQVYLLPTGGGEARAVTGVNGSISAYEWSPDGTRLALIVREKDKDAAERDADEQKGKLGIVSRHITRVMYKYDGAGYLPHNHAHIWLLDIAKEKMVQLTKGDFSVNDVTWSPDGSTLALVANLNDDAAMHIDAEQLYTIAVPAKLKGKKSAKSSKAFTQITDHEGGLFMPRYSPDGAQIALLGSDLKGNFWQNTDLYVVSAESNASIRNLTKVADWSVGGRGINDVNGGMPTQAPTWSADSKTIYVTMAKHGDDPLVGVNVADESVTWLVENACVGHFGFADGENSIVYHGGDTNDPGNIRLQTNSKTQQLSNHNKWIKPKHLRPVEMVWIEARDSYKLQGWIMTPPKFDESKTYPSILYIHGGPQAQYANWFFHEFQYLASQGYVVYFTNPRGGQGYGAEHCRAINGQWGTVDFDDLMDWTDFVSAKPYIDTDKMGVAGGSYGGYMTSLIIGRTDRFAAASAHRNVTNWISMWGTADFNRAWGDLAGIPPVWDDIEINWAQSPMSHISNAKTPTQVIHSEKDYRTNLEQSEQLYVALKMLNVDTEFIIFPDESHGLSRMGRTDRRMARLEHISRWFKKYLKE